MNTYKNLLVPFCLLLFFGMSTLTLAAQTPKKQFIDIKTSASCGGCKGKVERALKQEKGVIYAYHDMKKNVLTVRYKTKKITPDEIRQAIAAQGHDADDVKADPEAAAKDLCCKPSN